MLLFSSIYGRLGLTQIADSYCEVLLDCYAQLSPKDDVVRAISKRAWMVSAFSRSGCSYWIVTDCVFSIPGVTDVAKSFYRPIIRGYRCRNAKDAQTSQIR